MIFSGASIKIEIWQIAMDINIKGTWEHKIYHLIKNFSIKEIYPMNNCLINKENSKID